MTRGLTAVVTAAMVALGPSASLLAQRGAQRGSVSAASRGSRAGASGTTASKSGNTTTWQGGRGNASGSRTVSQDGDTYNVNKQVQTKSGASKSVSKEIDTDDREIDRSSTTTNQWGQSVSREREVEGKGGYAEIEGSAKTSSGREMSTEGVAGRTVTGRPAYAGSVNTKYNGNYNVAGAKNAYGGWTKAAAGPYGGRVTTTLPSGYRTTNYYGRPYYAYGGAYYRPYSYHGVHYYYPVPVPYYAYYESPPVGATILVMAGVKYLVSSSGSYSKETTSSSGQIVYQSVPAPQGAKLGALPPERVLVTVSNTTYYLSSNTFYRKVATSGQEQFVVVTAPAGIVFLSALPADFEVVELNTLYFKAQGRYYVPFMSSDGKELYVGVDSPPQPSAAPATRTAPPASTAAPAAAAPVREVAESFTVPAGTTLVVRLANDLSSATAKAGDRFQAFLDQDLAGGGRFIAPRGTRAYGMVTAADKGSKGSGKPSLSVTLTDITVGDNVVALQTQPLAVAGEAGKGGRKIAGGAALGAAIGAIADGGEGAAIGAAVGGGVGVAAAAAGAPKAAVLAAQAAASFTLAAPFTVQLMTNVAVR